MDISGTPAPIEKVEIDLRKQKYRLKRYSTETGDIVMNNDVIILLSHVLDLPSYNYDYDVRVSMTDGTFMYPFGGKFNLDEAITYPV